MNPTFESALRHFEATEANVAKLERLWKQIRELIPDGLFFGGPPEYQLYCLEYQHVLGVLPAIDGYRLEYKIPELNSIGQARLDAQEAGEIEASISVEESVDQPGHDLAEYKFRLKKKRRELIRVAISELISEVEIRLRSLGSLIENPPENINSAVEDPQWSEIKHLVKQIDTLLGDSVKRPAAWSPLIRHLNFGEIVDLRDIIITDWPAVSLYLQQNVYDENEPIPVDVQDLSTLVASRPIGAIPTKLHWENLTFEEFERLIFSLISNETEYENAQWLMKTKAPDKGRDLSVVRIIRDPLMEVRRERVIIQCKHWVERTVSSSDVSELKELVRLWEPPRVDVVIIATTGRFSADAVALVERQNESESALRVEMWPESHLERLLAQRPALIAEFRLRLKT